MQRLRRRLKQGKHDLLLESHGNLEICLIKFVDTLVVIIIIVTTIDTLTHRFNCHFPVQPGLAGCPLILSQKSSLSWASSQDRPKLCTHVVLWAVPDPLNINHHPKGF